MHNLETFTRKNLSNSNFINSWYHEDRNKILNCLYDKDFTINNAIDFLNEFKGNSVKDKVIQNFEISNQRQKARDLITIPVTGDIFIDDLDNKFRLVEIYKGHFQFCYEGSFHMGYSGNASMSGGFAFDVMHEGKEIGSIKSENLVKTNKKDFRNFWFWLDNSSGANRGIYFNCNVNIYKTK